MAKKTIKALLGMILVLAVAALAGWSGAADFLAAASNTWVWKTAIPLTNARSFNTATGLAGGHVLVAGGQGIDKKTGAAVVLNTSEFLICGNSRWAPPSKLNWARYRHTATLLSDGKSVLVAGGRSETDVSMDSCEIFVLSDDPATSVTGGTWYPAGKFEDAEGSDPRCRHTATLIKKGNNAGKVLVVGGINYTADKKVYPLMGCWLYNPATRTWAQAAPLTTPRFDHTATLLSDGKSVLVAGGFTTALASLATCAIYDADGDNWNDEVPIFNDSRGGHSATLLNDGRVLAVGGVSWKTGFSPVALRTCEIYDPAQPIPRWDNYVPSLDFVLDSPVTDYMTGIVEGYHAASLLTEAPNQGCVLVVGGGAKSGISASIISEIYHPDPSGPGEWVLNTPHLVAPGHTNPTATLLTQAPWKGFVLVTGGVASNFLSINATHFFRPPPPKASGAAGAVK